jgi:hypothetical protein
MKRTVAQARRAEYEIERVVPEHQENLLGGCGQSTIASSLFEAARQMRGALGMLDD